MATQACFGEDLCAVGLLSGEEIGLAGEVERRLKIVATTLLKWL